MLGFLGIVILVAIVFGVISFGSLLFAVFAEGKERAKDNDKPEIKTHCRILEKNVENSKAPTIGYKMVWVIEHIVIESDDGKRVKLRNLNANEILIAVGDTGTITYRGDTINSFERDL